MKMKLYKNAATRTASTMAIVLLGAGVFGSQVAVAGIANTKHNLGTSTNTAAGSAGFNKFDGTAEICVFCHTPHGSDTTASVPLWNRVLPAASTYTTYNSLGTSSLDGATAPVGSVSLACLSCHDGTQAMNVMINQPGSGGYNSAGAAMAGSWGGANQTAGKLKVGEITLIGNDLKNDHPIGIQYAGGPSGGGAVAGAGADYTSFKDADFATAKSATLNGSSVWWVNTTATGSTAGREKTDMQLYTRTVAATMSADGTTAGGAALTGAQPFVECASCHDPHSENVTFLRIPNTGSAVCLACHIK